MARNMFTIMIDQNIIIILLSITKITGISIRMSLESVRSLEGFRLNWRG